MRVSKKILSCAAALSLGGCVYYVTPASQTPPPAQVVDTTPPPQPEPLPAPAPAPVVVEYQPPPPEVAPVYETDLAPYGRWFHHTRYGRVWIPNYMPYGWRPYTVGHWIYTDDGACCWVSEDTETAWGGIVYHYGQWVLTPEFGWIWVPGTVWAPAWVAWREGGGYCGWTPLPPEACEGPVTVVVVDRYCPPDRYVYVDEHDFHGERLDRHFVHNDVTIINRTTNITNITVVNNTVINNGVPPEHIERATGVKVERVHVAEARNPDEARQLLLRGTPVRYTTPAIETVHAKVLDQQAKVQHEQEVKQHDQEVKQQEQADRAKQLQDRQRAADQTRQAELDKQAAHEKEVQAGQDAAREKEAEHAKEVAAQQQAARDAQAQREQQAAADKQAAHDRAVQAAKDAAAERQAERDKAAADKAAQPTPPARGKPKPGQQPAQPPQ